MAIIGSLDVLKKQSIGNERLLKGVQYLIEADLQQVFDKVAPGENQVVEICGKEVFAIFQEYDSKAPEQAKMEGHKKYIDIQYLHQGEEFILVGCIENVTQKGIYDEDNDIHFSEVETQTSLLLKPGFGCILFPEDMHAPGVFVQAPQRVKKIVLKVAVD